MGVASRGWERRTVIFSVSADPMNLWSTSGPVTMPVMVLLDLCGAASLLPDTCSLLASLSLSSAGTPNLVVTLSTRFADASVKYLRFSREIDWNNFSHTDSFERSRLQKREQQRRR